MKHRCSIILMMASAFIIIMHALIWNARGEENAVLPEQKLPYVNIFVLKPSIVYEDVRNEQNLESVDPLARLMLDEESARQSKDVFTQVGMAFSDETVLSPEQASAVKESCESLDKNAEDLVKQWKSKEAYSKEFSSIQTACGADCLLVQFVKVKVGQQGSWDFINTGAITPTTCTTSVKMVLIDLKNGKSVWSNSSIERSMPGKYIVKKLYESAYAKFPGYKKGGKR